MVNSLNKTDKATLAGLYIAKFDKQALMALGFTGMWQSFNVIGYSLGASPASIKNYRDEFDRLFPNNPRKGWQRPLKKRSEGIFKNFHSLDFVSFTDLIKSFLVSDYEAEKAVASIIKPDSGESFANRLITGKAAEEYFKSNYRSVHDFIDFELIDTTNLGCGFDFKLQNASLFFCVEVKGLSHNTGNILLTEKEYSCASEFRKNYCLFIVKNFVDKPNHQFFFDPLNSQLNFRQHKNTITVINYSTVI
jgi:hypothetical protein